jgi:hypothetical protein
MSQIKTKKLKKEAQEKIEDEKFDAFYALYRIEPSLDILRGNIGMCDATGHKLIKLLEANLERIQKHLKSVYGQKN